MFCLILALGSLATWHPVTANPSFLGTFSWLPTCADPGTSSLGDSAAGEATATLVATPSSRTFISNLDALRSKALSARWVGGITRRTSLTLLVTSLGSNESRRTPLTLQATSACKTRWTRLKDALGAESVRDSTTGTLLTLLARATLASHGPWRTTIALICVGDKETWRTLDGRWFGSWGIHASRTIRIRDLVVGTAAAPT